MNFFISFGFFDIFAELKVNNSLSASDSEVDLSRLLILMDHILYITPSMDNSTPLALLSLLNKRSGGQYALRGFVFQTNYIIWKLLKEFAESQNESLVFRPEGVEDLDVHCKISETTTNVYTQIKCLNEALDTSKFTSSILPNLLEVYTLDPESKFRVVSNKYFSQGLLGKLKEASVKRIALKPRDFEEWAGKIRVIKHQLSDEEIKDFLSKVTFEQKEGADLIEDSLKILIKHFDIIQGNEKQFHNALFYAVLDWSMEKKEVRRQDILSVIQSVKDERLENQVLRNGWVLEVLFEKTADITIEKSYFEGKPARPHHIAANLPVARPDWEQQIIASIQEFDVTVVKSSSGQGKSTLAWQVAQTMASERFRVYELLEVPSDGLHDFVLFLKSRLKIGIVPIVVIDGLNKQVEEWSELAARTQALRGVKFLVTTREEDWFRYGNRVSRLFLKPINIELNPKEAEVIFRALKNRNMVHPNIRTWQIAWDEVKSEKLLLEFVYLLAQGKMLRDRLEDQLNMMRTEPENHAKKSVLRVVAMADVLNLRLPTSNLTNHIKTAIGFVGDRNDLLQSLKNEYYIQIEGAEFTEGLHPVRSKHLTDILHSSTPLVDTLLELVTLLEPESLSDFASRSPRLLQTMEQRAQFFQLLSEKVSEKPYSEILKLTIGVWGSDAYLHWLQNKEIYDRLSNKGLFLYTALRAPFGGFKVSSLDTIFEINPGIKTNLAAISEYDVSNSNVCFFLKNIHRKLRQMPLKSSLTGALDLERWLERFDLSMGLMNKLTIDSLNSAIEELDVVSLAQVLHGVFLLNTSLYHQIYSKFGNEILIKLIRETDSLRIEPAESETLRVRYLVEEEGSINEQSVERLRLIAYCLPFYKKYEISGVYFPNPLLKQYRAGFDESVKAFTWENGLKYDAFITQANGYWNTMIENEYEFSTHFEWQEYWFEFRREFLAWIKQSCQVLESVMDKKRKYAKEEEGWKKKTQQLEALKDRQRGVRYDIFFTKVRFESAVKQIENWASSTSNAVLQFAKITDANIRRLLQLNALDLYGKLLEMQESFDEIVLQTGRYFDTDELSNQEINTYRYFSDLISFYDNDFMANPRVLYSARQEVKSWVEAKRQREIDKLEGVKMFFDELTNFKLILPNKIIEEAYFSSVVLGISETSAEEFKENIFMIIENLQGLLHLDSSFFYLIPIVRGVASKNVALRLQKESLQQLAEYFEGRAEELPQPLFLPMPLTPEIITCLSGIQMEQVSEADKRKGEILLLHKVLWEYSETKRSLNIQGCEPLKAQRLEKMVVKIKNHLDALLPDSVIYEKYSLLVKYVLLELVSFDEEMCERLFFEDMG